MSRVHPAVQIVREFEQESDATERACNLIALQLERGEITEAEFDLEAHRILGDDYPLDDGPMDSSEGFGYWPGEDDDMRPRRRRNMSWGRS